MGRVQPSTLVLFAALGMTFGCGSKDSGAKGLVRPTVAAGPTASVTVTTTFPSDAVKTTTNTVHVWVLTSAGDAGSSCGDLVGGKVDPYDPGFDRLGDVVSKDLSTAATLSGVSVGGAFVYVEAVGYDGSVEYAGCAAIDVKGPSSTFTITLGKAGVFDCTDPATKDGSPCDDGNLCTVGETCQSHSCTGGMPRTCTGATTTCSAGVCDPTKGCVTTPVADETPCDDKLACTTGDVCQAGQCVGKPRDCTAEAGLCGTSTGCSELQGGCQVVSAGNYGVACDDGFFCTTNDKCNIEGKCQGTPRDCTNGGCSTGTCDEASGKCQSTPIETAGTFCSDGLYCTSGDACDALGNCVGKPVTCSSACATCNEADFGTCSTYKISGTACDDGNACTTGDTCSGGGFCSGTYAIQGTSCGAPCIIGGLCDNFGDCTGNSDAPFGTLCNDGNACTTGDECNGAGTCTGSVNTCQ